MGSFAISGISFAFIFGGGLLGILLRNILPEHHISDKSKDAMKMGAGLIATLTALVLGLLVSSAKNSFDTMNTEITQGGAKVIQLDHLLSQYGPEANDARELLRRNLRLGINKIWPEDNSKPEGVKALEGSKGAEDINDKIRALNPKNDTQRLIQSQALQISGDISQARWLLIEQSENALPTPFIVVLVFWLTIFFISFGLMAPANPTSITIVFVCALSVAGAIFLILELNRPLEGMIKVSEAPLRKALIHISK